MLRAVEGVRIDARRHARVAHHREPGDRLLERRLGRLRLRIEAHVDVHRDEERQDRAAIRRVADARGIRRGARPHVLLVDAQERLAIGGAVASGARLGLHLLLLLHQAPQLLPRLRRALRGHGHAEVPVDQIAAVVAVHAGRPRRLHLERAAGAAGCLLDLRGRRRRRRRPRRLGHGDVDRRGVERARGPAHPPHHGEGARDHGEHDDHLDRRHERKQIHLSDVPRARRKESDPAKSF
jgi:hypothetical protein